MSNCNLEMLAFQEGEKYLEKNPRNKARTNKKVNAKFMAPSRNKTQATLEGGAIAPVPEVVKN